MSFFSSALIAWQREHGRHGLPWQGAEAYRVWLSEIMLQQTQVATVIPYYQRFVASFPTIAALAAAGEEQVLAHWSGLGYYARGRNLHRAARIVVSLHGGEFPCQFEQILALPGIGRSTAAAICALAFQQRHAILDGNVRRVLARYCGVSGSPASKPVEQLLWQHAEALLPEHDVAAYTQALMDMGATLCTRSRPRCVSCPVQGGCVAHQTGRVAELPAPRVRRAVPERQVDFLLAMHGREIWLERRDPTGIWGGLWCMPQLEEGDEMLAEYAQRRNWQIIEQNTLPAFTHVFTHFKLHITPQLLRLADKPLGVQQSGGRWLDAEEALRAAIPAPVRKLLASICYTGDAESAR
jgi:A/G-specific adenine glycosylase